MATGDGMIIVKRYKMRPQPQFEYLSDHPDRLGEGMIPSGVKLERPWPTAQVHFTSHESGWLMVWWIDGKLKKPPEQGE